MKRFKHILPMTKKVLTDPAGAAGDFAAPGAGSGGPLAVYFIYCAAYALFLYMKPAGFPAEFSEAAREFSGSSYPWLFSVLASFELAFTAVFCVFFAVIAGFLREGRLALKFLSGCAACGSYAAAAFYFKAEPLFSLFFPAAAGTAAYAGVRAKKASTAAFFRFSLTVNAAILLCLPVYALATALRNETFYTAAEAAGGIWMAVLTIKAARTLFGVTTVRAALALVFSLIAAICSFYMLKNLGLIPSAVFRFLLYM